MHQSAALAAKGSNDNKKIFQKQCMGRGLELDRDRQGAAEHPGVWGGV